MSKGQNTPSMNDMATVQARLNELAFQAYRHVLCLGVKKRRADTPYDRAFYGTFTLLRLQERDVLVTCHHVLKKLRELQEEDQTAEIAAYLVPPGVNSPGQLEELTGFQFIDGDKNSLDVAVFGGSESRLELPGMVFLDYNTSYLPDPTGEDLVAIVGYPGANVNVTQKKVAINLMQLFLGASSVSERQIKLVDEKGTWTFKQFGEPTFQQIALGGLSGSPAFVVRREGLRFVGIVTDGSIESHMIFVSRLGCLNPDGTLRHTEIAW